MQRFFLLGLVALTLACSPAGAQERMLDGFAPASPSTKQVVDADAKKICVIGNSHIGAMRKAVKDGLFTDRKLDLVFWGFPGREYFKIKFENGRFTHPDKQRALAVSDGRYETITPKDFDALVFVGGMNGSRLYSLASQNDIETQIGMLIAKNPIVAMMKEAAHDFSGKLLFVPGPLRSELSPNRPQSISTERIEAVNRAAEKVFAKNGIIFVPQPAQTISVNGGTRREYSLENNFGHMSSRYGQAVLEAIRERLRAAN